MLRAVSPPGQKAPNGIPKAVQPKISQVNPLPHNPKIIGIGQQDKPFPPICVSEPPKEAQKVEEVVLQNGPLAQPHNTEELKDLVSFLKSSPTAWQAVHQMRLRLLEAGSTEIPEDEQLFERLELPYFPGGKYFTTVNGSSICAFILPIQHTELATILGAHTDSPCYKLKPHPEKTSQNVSQLAVDTYGGPIGPSWFNRDLALAGRIVVQDGDGNVFEQLVHIDRPLASIPTPPIHLDRSLGSKLEFNRQKHLPAMVGLDIVPPEGQGLLEYILIEEGCLTEQDQLLSHELFLVPAEKPKYVGLKKDFLASWRLDNLLGTHAALEALLEHAEPDETGVKMVVAWDNEEVGSATRQGAESPFLKGILEAIFRKGAKTDGYFGTAMKNSLLVSIDVAHALNPNYPEKHEPSHQPLLGHGVVIKHNAQQHYATDARSEALVKGACNKVDVPYQAFVVPGDSCCGTTIGPLAATQLGVLTVDVGAPIWSMHNIREQCSPKDHLYMIQFLGEMLDL